MFGTSGNRVYYEFLGLGAELALAMSLPVVAGFWLDKRWESSPWMLFAGIGLGLLLVTGIFIRVIRRVTSKKGDQ